MTIITERKIEKRKRQKDRRKSLGENESRHPNMNLLLPGMWTNTPSACPNRIWPRSRTHLKGMYTHTHPEGISIPSISNRHRASAPGLEIGTIFPSV